MYIKLDSIRLTHVRVPLCEPFVISNGVVAEKDGILVELLADGLCGLGEASPMSGSFYSHHTPESSWETMIQKLVPALEKAPRLSLDAGWVPADADDPFAVAGLDNAMWDLLARAHNKPLWQLLGGDAKKEIASGLAVGIYKTIDELLERVERYLAAGGYRRVKIKVQPGWDIVPLEAIRRRFGDLSLMVDANCAYRRTDIEHVAGWDRFKLMMIEQPLPREDLEGHALLAARCRTPVCLDESAETVAAVQTAIELKSASIVNIKLQRVGSLLAARKVHNMTEAAGVGCWMGTMPELGVGAYHAVHFASLPNVIYPTDVEASDRWFVAEVTEPAVEVRKGLLSLPTGAGLGVTLNRKTIEKYKVREWSKPLACQLEG